MALVVELGHQAKHGCLTLHSISNIRKSIGGYFALSSEDLGNLL